MLLHLVCICNNDMTVITVVSLGADSPDVFCLCGQGEYGEMIGCDNPTCLIEWFHMGCVGLTSLPEGDWMCTFCKGM